MPSKPTDYPRRHFLRWGLGCAASAVLAGFAPLAAGKSKDWRQVILDRDRWLSLERSETGERAVFLYYRYGAGFDADGYRIACHLLRDVKSGVAHRMDGRLLDLLFILQGWLRLNKLPFHIVILSGYRTPEHNAHLPKAAKKSQHMNGTAADIRIPGLKVADLKRLALAVGVGGVGSYAYSGFIHVDVGRVRKWEG